MEVKEEIKSKRIVRGIKFFTSEDIAQILGLSILISSVISEKWSNSWSHKGRQTLVCQQSKSGQMVDWEFYIH